GRRSKPLEKARRDQAKEESSDVGGIGDTAGLDVRYGTNLAEELEDKPDSDQQRGGNHGCADKDEYHEQNEYAISGVRNQKRAHHAGDGAARAQIRNVRVWRQEDLRQRGGDSAEQVEGQISHSSHRIFDLGTEGMKEDHVADNVHPAAMHKHRAQDR